MYIYIHIPTRVYPPWDHFVFLGTSEVAGNLQVNSCSLHCFLWVRCFLYMLIMVLREYLISRPPFPQAMPSQALRTASGPTAVVVALCRLSGPQAPQRNIYIFIYIYIHIYMYIHIYICIYICSIGSSNTHS